MPMGRTFSLEILYHEMYLLVDLQCSLPVEVHAIRKNLTTK